MWKDRYKIEDKKDLDIVGFLTGIVALCSTFLILLKAGEIVPGLLLTFTLLALYAIVLLRNLKVLKSERYKKFYRWLAYSILIIYPFYMIGIIWLRYFYLP
jgi:hypothetical protein